MVCKIDDIQDVNDYSSLYCYITIYYLQRLASELVIIDTNEGLVKAEAEDLGHAAAFYGNPQIIGTKGDLMMNSKRIHSNQTFTSSIILKLRLLICFVEII